MPIDTAKMAKLSEEVNSLEEALKAARKRLMDAVSEATSGSAPIPVVSLEPVENNKAEWGAVTEAILEYASDNPPFKVREMYQALLKKGYSAQYNTCKARVHALLKDKRLKKVSPGHYTVGKKA